MGEYVGFGRLAPDAGQPAAGVTVGVLVQAVHRRVGVGGELAAGLGPEGREVRCRNLRERCRRRCVGAGCVGADELGQGLGIWLSGRPPVQRRRVGVLDGLGDQPQPDAAQRGEAGDLIDHAGRQPLGVHDNQFGNRPGAQPADEQLPVALGVAQLAGDVVALAEGGEEVLAEL